MTIQLNGKTPTKITMRKQGSNFATQGPCPDGFHVPSLSETTLLYNTFTWIGLSASNFTNYLKIPLAGYMDSSATVTDQGVAARIVTCTTRSDRDTRCMYLYATGNDAGPNYNLYKGYYAFSIRPFKDEPVIPDNTWTTIYSGSGGKGIYHNATLGLISLSSDGSTWLTIADKNLGATTVFNTGDTLSEANSGKYYQRGNNYGFPGIGSSETITTSSTKVDTTGYGPGNYYTSSTYIKAGQDWSNPSNNNLWGGVTGSVPMLEEKEIKKIVIFPDGVTEKQIRPDVKPTPLCFTAQQVNSTVTLNKTGNPTAVNLETSTDGTIWTDYTIGNSITLANVGDKVYMRNKSETTTGFSTNASNYYNFFMAGKIGASGDITSLLNKNGTTTLSTSCYWSLFRGCTSLTTAPSLPATTLANDCYNSMFYGCTSLVTPSELPAITLARSCYFSMFRGCTSLTTAPSLPATTLANMCYQNMFRGCTNIKLSETQIGEYQIPYRIPTDGIGTDATSTLYSMFTDTGGTFTGTPTINKTYYTSNQVI